MELSRLIDHYLFRIYTTFQRINRFMKLHRGPVNHAAGTAAYIPTGYLASVTLYLDLWRNVYLQFISSTLIVSAFVFLSFFFDKRLKKIISSFRNETYINRLLSIIGTNLFILISYCLIIYFFFKKIG